MPTTKGKLFVIPTIIADDTAARVIPRHVLDALPDITHFLVENIRTARRYLSSLKIYPSIEALHFEVLDKDTKSEQLTSYFEVINQGKHLGILSESGCPGIADPGALAVAHAHRHGIRVIPLTGPSSILLALMASGLNGQRFAFHGYIPIDTKEQAASIKTYERESKLHNQTQIFIETPYRNKLLFEALIRHLQPPTQLTVAIDVTGQSEFILTKTVANWRKETVAWPKLPALFLFLA